MKVKKENVDEVLKVLEDLTDKYGYRALEVGFLIGCVSNGENEITEKQVNEINDYIDCLDDIIDEGVAMEIYHIVNEEV